MAQVLRHDATIDPDLRLGGHAQRQPHPSTWAGRFVPAPAPQSQQTVVVGHIIKGKRQNVMGHGGKPVPQYLQAGKGVDGRDAVLFGREGQHVDPQRFMQQVQGDPHQFRLTVSLRNSSPFFAMQPYIESLLRRMEKDLGRPLDWVAAVHRDTDHLHAHIVLRGRDRAGQDLYINNDYLARGLRYRADEMATWLLGPDRSREQEISQQQARAPEQQRRLTLNHAVERQRGQEMGL